MTNPPMQPRRYGWLFWALLPVGGLLMAWGLVGLLRQAGSTVPASWLGWFLGGLLAHDLLLAPAVFAVGLAVRRLPAALQPPARAALIVSGTLGLLTVPLLLGYGRATQPGNISLLSGNYPISLALVLVAVWAVAGRGPCAPSRVVEADASVLVGPGAIVATARIRWSSATASRSQAPNQHRVIYCVGGVASPLLANVVLHRLDRAWQAGYRRLGVLVRYCDDLVILCPTRERADAALVALTGILDELGLRLAVAKTHKVSGSPG